MNKVKKIKKDKKFYINTIRKRLFALNMIDSTVSDSNRKYYDEILKDIDLVILDAVQGNDEYASLTNDINNELGGGSNE